MRITSFVFCAAVFSLSLTAQVLSPEEVRDPQMSALQRRYFGELKQITAAASAHTFPYDFSFSRTLDLSKKDQRSTDQRSVQFDRYRDRVVLKITGNYFAAYSAELMTPSERARKTYQDVMLPLLQAAVPALEKAEMPQAFAFEISHHVMRKVLGVSSEAVENVVLVISRESAQRAVAIADPALQQAAVLEGEAFLNAVPISLWPQLAPLQISRISPGLPAPIVSPSRPVGAGIPGGILAKQPAVARVDNAPVEAAPRLRDSSPDALKALQRSWQPELDKLVQENDTQAHFVRYAPPALIPFHDGLYLQLSVTTMLPSTAAGSQYMLAALAFDHHIAHLIRPVLSYFRTREDLDGVNFSTSVRLAGNQAAEGSSVAVEFILPLSLMQSYARFDSTGQQLIDASYVLVNGERISLNLQMAEGGFQPK